MSTTTESSDRVRAVIDRIAGRREELAERMTERILADVEEYSDADTTELIPAVEANCRDHFDSFVAYVQTGALPSLARGSQLSAPVLDRIRQGIRLDAYLHAFRVGQNFFWEEILAEARDDPDTALEFAGPSMTYIDLVCTRMAEIYLEASQKLRSDEERASRDLLEVMIGGVAPDAAQLRLMAATGIAGRAIVAVLREPREQPEATEDSLRAAVERALRGAGTSGLVVRRQRELVSIIGLADGPPSAVVAALRKASGGDTLCGISAEAERTEDIPRALEQAHAALDRACLGNPVVALSEAGAYEYMLLSADPMLTRMVSRDLRAALDPSTTDGATTAETARAYLECDLSARDAAERLFVHPNTLRYRLHQLEERAGIDLKRFADLVELRIALDFSDPPRSPELPRP
jgi:hypothetical protein